MENIKTYFISKLFAINYRIATHEGNANRRLASQAPQILFQLTTFRRAVPDRYKKQFAKFIVLIDNTVADTDGFIPIRIKSIQNKTAAKYIKLLIDMQEHFRND